MGPPAPPINVFPHFSVSSLLKNTIFAGLLTSRLANVVLREILENGNRGATKGDEARFIILFICFDH